MGYGVVAIHALSAFYFLRYPGNMPKEETEDEIIQNLTGNNINNLMDNIVGKKVDREPIMFSPPAYAPPTNPKLNNEGNYN